MHRIKLNLVRSFALVSGLIVILLNQIQVLLSLASLYWAMFLVNPASDLKSTF